jgi:hypothetical protein
MGIEGTLTSSAYRSGCGGRLSAPWTRPNPTARCPSRVEASCFYYLCCRYVYIRRTSINCRRCYTCSCTLWGIWVPRLQCLGSSPSSRMPTYLECDSSVYLSEGFTSPWMVADPWCGPRAWSSGEKREQPSSHWPPVCAWGSSSCTRVQ